MRVFKVLLVALIATIFSAFILEASDNVVITNIDGVVEISIPGYETITARNMSELLALLEEQGLSLNDISSAVIAVRSGSAVVEAAGEEITISAGSRVSVSTEEGFLNISVLAGSASVVNKITGEKRDLSSGETISLEIVAPERLEIIPEPDLPEEETEASPYIP